MAIWLRENLADTYYGRQTLKHLEIKKDRTNKSESFKILTVLLTVPFDSNFRQPT